MSLEIEGMLLPIQYRFNDKKGLDFGSTLLRIFKPKFYSNIEIKIRKIKSLIRFGI